MATVVEQIDTKSMHKSNIITLIVIVAVFITAGVITYIVRAIPNDKANSEAQKSLATSEEQVFTDLQGNPISFKQFEGKVRVVNAWASWTPFSVQELRDLETLAGEYKDTDVVVIAVNRKEPKEVAVQFLESIRTFEHTVFAIDITDSFYKSIGGFSMPETVFYDARGTIVLHKRGSMSLTEMRSHLDKVLSADK